MASGVIEVCLNTSPEIPVELTYVAIVGLDYLVDADGAVLLDAAGDMIYG